MFRTLLLATTLLAAPVATASAAQFTTVHIDTGAKLCPNRTAGTHKEAFIRCMGEFGLVVPYANAIMTISPVCRSTHKIVLLGQTNPRWAYDNRFARPGCS